MSIEATGEVLLAHDGHAVAQGHKSSREPRTSMLRTINLIHNDNRYTARIRNVSASGALIEGIADVPPGTVFTVEFGGHYQVKGLCRWSHDDKMGVEFDEPVSVERIRATDKPLAVVATHEVPKADRKRA